MANSTRQNRYKNGVHIGLKHNRTRKGYFLIIDPFEIEKKTGNFNTKARPICSGCNNPTVSLKPDFGITATIRRPEIARYCQYCEVIFPKYRKVVSTYDQYR